MNLRKLIASCRHSFRARIFVSLTLMILFFIPMTGYISYRQVRQITENQMQQYAQATAEQIVNRVDSFLAQHSYNVSLIKSLLEAHSIDPRQERVMLRYFQLFRQDHPEFVNIYYADEDGRFLMVPPQSPEIFTIYEPRSRPWYLGAARSKKLHWTDVYHFASSQKPGITVSVPIFEDGRLLRGVCGIDIDLSQFSRFLQGIELRKQGVAYIFENHAGSVIAHSGLANLLWNPDQVNLARESVVTLRNQDKTTGLTPFQGKDYFTALTPYPGRNWTVGVSLSMLEYHRNIETLKKITVTLVVAGIMLSSLLSLLLTRTIVRPLHLLRQGIERISRGELNYKLTIADPDIASDLANSFNQMAASLRNSLDELQIASMELAANEKLAAVGQMTASIAHEIKNPLGVIHGAAQIVANPNKTPAMREKAATFITEEVQRLNNTLTSFLAFAKPAPPEFAPLDIIECIDTTLFAIEDRYQQEGYRFIRNYPSQPVPAIEADGDQVRQVVWNILLNSFEAMPDGGEITISLRECKNPPASKSEPQHDTAPLSVGNEQNWLQVSISDTGCGMSERQIEQVMDPFVSFRDGGTGLGLSIVAQIMKLHRGTITITSSEGKGTTFHLAFPCITGEK